MRLISFFSVLVWASLAWAYFSPAQLEILDLHHKIQPKDKGNNAEIRSFYSILSVSPKVNEQDLEKAYKKLTRKWHPDKFARKDIKERKKAERKYETISLVVNILRDVERRRNYDYFLKNGFPVWSRQKNTYVFTNRSKPSLKLVGGVLLFLITLGQIGLFKLNRTQKNKRVKQILRDVRWKADNQEQQNNKIMELPDDFDAVSTPIYSIDDKFVTYCGKVFIVKPDKSVLLYDDESLDVENESQMNDLVKKIIDSGHFNLYGFEKKVMNRKERRSEQRAKSNESSESGIDILDKLVQFKEDDSALPLSSLLVFKPLFAVVSLLKNNKTVETEENADIEDESSTSDTTVLDKPLAKDGKITLPNGKVLHSRKK